MEPEKSLIRKLHDRWYLRRLGKWADSFKGRGFPTEHAGEQYWNYKIGCRDSLVEGPDVTDEVLRATSTAMLRAARYLIDERPPEFKDTVVAVTLFYPGYHASEICVYFNSTYFDEINPEPEVEPEGPSFSERLGFEVPEGFTEIGNVLERLPDKYYMDDDGNMPVWDSTTMGPMALRGVDEEQRWTYLEDRLW